MASAYALVRSPSERRCFVRPALEVPEQIRRELTAVDAAKQALDVTFKVAHAHAQRLGRLSLREQDPGRGSVRSAAIENAAPPWVGSSPASSRSRWRGLRSLFGLALSLLLVGAFVVPAILHGSEPVLVAVVGAMAIMLCTIFLAHGGGPKSVAAMLGTAASLGITVAARSALHGTYGAERHGLRPERPARGRPRAGLAQGPGTRGNGHRRARCARRRDGQPGIGGDGPARRRPSAGRPRAVSARALDRSRPRR